jgi:hypothetical protein
VLLLGVHPAEVIAPSRRGRTGRAKRGEGKAEVDVEAALEWRDFMVLGYSGAGHGRRFAHLDCSR